MRGARRIAEDRLPSAEIRISDPMIEAGLHFAEAPTVLLSPAQLTP